MTKFKKFAAAIAATAAVAITSAVAFAVDEMHWYNITTAFGTKSFNDDADAKYMYYNTRPSLPGSVRLTVKGDGLPVGGTEGTNFPSQVARAPFRITTVNGATYTATVEAQGYPASGYLVVKSSDSPNLNF